jgi:hypothetical protein
VSRTTGSSVVASSCDPADGRQERRRVAPEASDGPILPPIGGIAKQAGFAERRYGDQLHGSDRGLRWSFVSIHILDRLAGSKYRLSTLIHPGKEMLAGVPRERRRATRAVDEWTRVERGAYWSIGPFTTLSAVTTVRSDGPRAPPESSYHQLTGGTLHAQCLLRIRSSGRGTLSFRLKRPRTDLLLYLRTTLLEWDRQPTN